MNANESNPQLQPADERVMNKLRGEQRFLRALTALAIVFWVLAVIASVGVLVCYSVIYAPKERQIMADYETSGHLVGRTNAPGGSQEAGRMDTDKALGLHFTMNYVVTKGLLVIAVSVVVLSCGTLITLLLVILNRRVTLKQINHSLAQISAQLKQLQERS
jgi:hypothetical protein